MRGRLTFIKIITIVITLIFCFSFFSSCIKSEKDSKIVVSIVNGNCYSVKDSTFSIRRGEDVTFEIIFEDGLSFSDCSYKDYNVEEADSHTFLTLHKVLFPTIISVSVSTVDIVIEYKANGGTLLKNSGYSFVKKYNLENHKRINTAIGTDELYREGYVLTGWNTAADKSGNHIGLGSRFSAENDNYYTLYAEWEKCNDELDFNFSMGDDGIILTGYNGATDCSQIVLPEKIQGQNVVAINVGFAKNLKVNRLILPITLKRIEDSAFSRCSIQTICFYDNLLYVADTSFRISQINQWQINAVNSPRFLSSNDNARFADDMDRLILNANNKKMVFFGGCSMSYGLNSSYLSEKFPDYTVCNMGVIGGINAAFQLDCIKAYLIKDDILIHAPEEESAFQLMASFIAESRMFVLCEGNFDLISLIDMSKISGEFSAYAAFAQSREMIEKGSYDDKNDHYNEYGDYCVERINTDGDVSFSNYEYGYDLSLATEKSVSALCDQYDGISKKGAKVFFTFAPVNYNGLTKDDINNRVWKSFSEYYVDKLGERGYNVISSIEDYLLKGRYFYDTDYHLTTEGALFRSQKLAEDIQKFL